MLEKWLWRKKAKKHKITMRHRATVRRFRGEKLGKTREEGGGGGKEAKE